MSDLIIELEKAIEKAAKEYDLKFIEEGNFNDSLHCATSFRAGAQFILPLLKKAVEQRNAYPESDYPVNMCKNSIEIDNKELLKLLGGEK